jgi:AFG3 family protein
VALGGQAALLIMLIGIGALIANVGRPDVQEISFQHFKNSLLANKMVDKVEVTNKTTAKVYVRPGSRCVHASGTCLSER